MKKILALLLTLALLFSLAACGGGGEEKTPSNEDKTPGSSQQQTQTSKPDESKPADSQPSGEEKSPAEKADETAAGFGSYNGKPIVWRVLAVDVQNEKALLITKDLLDEIKFHEEEEPENLTWETSDLRAWLGGEFYDTAFTDEQKVKILEVVNPADTNSESGAQGGNDTTDKVFILSASEMLQYFADDEDMAGFIGDEGFSYWTRTPGNDTTGYVCTYIGGGLYMTGNQAESTSVAVRPAIWVNLSDEQADPVEDEPEDKGGTDADGWPVADYITAGMKYTGAGKIVDASTWKQDDTIVVWRVYFDAASVDEVAAYIDALKAEGFTYWPLFDDEEEQAAGTFSTFGYEWQAEIANGPYVEIQHYEEPTDEFSGVDLAQLKIVLYSENPNA